MFYYKFVADTPYCGTETEYYYCFKNKPATKELEELAEEFRIDHAQGYEYLVTGWDDENIEDMSEDEISEMIDNYYADCNCSWEKITKEEFEENI